MDILERFTHGPIPCMYLADRQARLDYELVASLTPQAYEERMNQGWRKFGHLLFHPVCGACTECRPIRVATDQFRPDRSQRRAAKRNADLQVRSAAPIVDPRRLDLYARYHAAQAAQKDWPDQEISVQDYAFTFVHSPLPAVEISIWEGDALRAVAIVDVTPNVVSAVYHYYDPDHAHRSLGTFTLLQIIELARTLGRPHVYFGYYVAGCPSMVYKGRFSPSEVLSTDGVWQPLDARLPQAILRP